MTEPVVSIVVPTYNSERFIRATAQSLFDQTYRPMEVVFVDDGSTDGTRVLLERLQEEARDYMVDVKIVYQEQNRGVSACRNAGLAVSKGGLCGFLDSDDIYDRNKVARQVEALIDDQSRDFVYGPVRVLEGEHRLYAERPYELMEATILQLSSSRFTTLGPLFRRSFLESTGGWDERLRTCTDWEFHQRLLYTRPNFKHTPDAIAYYRMEGRDPNTRVSISAAETDPRRIKRLALGQTARLRSAIERAPSWAYGHHKFRYAIEQQVFEVCSFLAIHEHTAEACTLSKLAKDHMGVWSGHKSHAFRRLERLERDPVRSCAAFQRNRQLVQPFQKAAHKVRTIVRRSRVAALVLERRTEDSPRRVARTGVHPSHAVIFVADRDGMGPIFDSAYLAPARLLHSPERVAGVVALVSPGALLKPQLTRQWNDKLDEWRPKMGLLWSYPTLARRTASAAWDRISLGCAMSSVRNQFGAKQLVVSTGAARLIPILSDLRQHGTIDRIVYHVWGPDAEEHSYALQNRAGSLAKTGEVSRVDLQQRKAIALADGIISISRAMTYWLTNEMEANPKRVFEIPWLTDASIFDEPLIHRERVRQMLGLDETLVLGYCGSMLAWQLEPLALSAIVGAARLTGNQVRFLGLSMHQDALRKTLLESGLKENEIVLLNLPYIQVPQYLSAMDFGILGRNLMRPAALVNQLSSPVKFGEYLLSGVPVIISDALTDFADLTRANNIGLVVGEGATRDSIASDLIVLLGGDATTRSKLSARCIETARRHLTYQSRMNSYADAHGVEFGS